MFFEITTALSEVVAPGPALDVIPSWVKCANEAVEVDFYVDVLPVK